MNYMFGIPLVFAGLYFANFGARLLFQKGYVEMNEEKVWKTNYKKGTSGYNYDKYLRGIESLLTGIMFFGAGCYMLYFQIFKQ